MDTYKGAVAYVRMMDGTLKKGSKIHLLGTKMEFEVLDLGHFSPSYLSDSSLSEGEIGYIVTGAPQWLFSELDHIYLMLFSREQLLPSVN